MYACTKHAFKIFVYVVFTYDIRLLRFSVVVLSEQRLYCKQIFFLAI